MPLIAQRGPVEGRKSPDDFYLAVPPSAPTYLRKPALSVLWMASTRLTVERTGGLSEPPTANRRTVVAGERLRAHREATIGGFPTYSD